MLIATRPFKVSQPCADTGFLSITAWYKYGVLRGIACDNRRTVERHPKRPGVKQPTSTHPCLFFDSRLLHTQRQPVLHQLRHCRQRPHYLPGQRHPMPSAGAHCDAPFAHCGQLWSACSCLPLVPWPELQPPHRPPQGGTETIDLCTADKYAPQGAERADGCPSTVTFASVEYVCRDSQFTMPTIGPTAGETQCKELTSELAGLRGGW